MNIRSNPDTTLPAVTTGPLPSSRKIFATPDTAPDLRVPLREIMLSEGAGEPNLPVYDTSGPYTDPQQTIDVNAGLPRTRKAWVLERGGYEGCIGLDVKAMRTTKAEDQTRHLANSKRVFERLVDLARSVDGARVEALRAARDYEGLEMYIIEHLLGKK